MLDVILIEGDKEHSHEFYFVPIKLGGSSRYYIYECEISLTTGDGFICGLKEQEATKYVQTLPREKVFTIEKYMLNLTKPLEPKDYLKGMSDF